MKKILILLSLFLLVASQAFAVDWATVSQVCKWSGTDGTDCLQILRAGVNDKPYVVLPDGRYISTPSALYAAEYYPQTVVTPDISGYTYPIQDGATWTFENNEITKTLVYRERNTEEKAELMPKAAYTIWKVLITNEILTAAQITPHITQAEIDGYLARVALGQ